METESVLFISDGFINEHGHNILAAPKRMEKPWES